MLATWLIELYLNDLGCLSDEGDKAGHASLQTQFQRFLRTPALRECLEENKKTVYSLISSHGAVEDLVYFATLMKGTAPPPYSPHFIDIGFIMLRYKFFE